MSAYNFETLLEHVGHAVEIVTYGNSREHIYNVAIECTDCNEVLLDYENPKDSEFWDEIAWGEERCKQDD
jgi:hypothetical protein